jgi:hypothetical protein
MSLYIATLDEMKQELGLTDAQDDAKVLRLMELLQGRFEEHCNRRFERAAGAIEFFDGGKIWLLTRRFPLESVAAVFVDDDGAFGAGTQLEDGDFKVNLERGRIAYGAAGLPWPGGIGGIKVVYTGGYVAAGTAAAAGQYAMPEGLRRAFFYQASYEFRNRLVLGQQSVGQGGQSVSLAPAKLLPEVADGLAPFVRR